MFNDIQTIVGMANNYTLYENIAQQLWNDNNNVWKDFVRKFQTPAQPSWAAAEKKGLLHVGPKAAGLDFLFLGENYCL